MGFEDCNLQIHSSLTTLYFYMMMTFAVLCVKNSCPQFDVSNSTIQRSLTIALLYDALAAYSQPYPYKVSTQMILKPSSFLTGATMLTRRVIFALR